ncbi:MAG TPA: protein kinase [Phycisphaerae bacterium]|nr:protein kinase [Phycisphaerae bacterium]
MTPDRHERITDLFSEAVELPPRDRADFLNKACGDDVSLRDEITSLLAHDHAGSSAFDSPILGTGFNVTQAVAADTALETDLPEEIGPYRVLGLLGAGSMGVVYRAQQVTPPREVAVKVMHPGRASRSLRRRFLAEMESLARLRHPGIAQIYDAGEDLTVTGPQPYIAMELVTGQPLPVYAAERHLGSAARIGLLAKVCDAVHHAHQQGVIHRDLKPANILVENGDIGPRPRILDFGVARIVERGMEVATAATQDGQIVGTLAYMSPEQIEGNPHAIDTRCDIYALGAIGYELLCGRLPIDVSTSSLHAGMHAILDQRPKPLATHGRQFRGDLSRIFAKALAKNKEDRYDSAAAMAADLRNYLEHRPITARPPSAVYVLTKFARRYRLVVAALVVGVTLAAVGLIRAHLARQALQAQYTESRDVASFLVREFTDKLDEIGGTNEVRRDMLYRLRAHIERLLAQDPADFKVQIAYADVLKGLSDLDLAEGNLDRALELRKQVLEIRRQLAARFPADPDRQADLSIALVLVGDVPHDRGDSRGAAEFYQQALVIDETLVRLDPGSRHFCSNLLWSYIRLSRLACDLGDADQVRQCVERGLQTQDTMLARNPDDTDALHARICLDQLLSDVAVNEGRLSVAITHMTDAVPTARRLLALAPTNSVYQHDCAGVLVSAAELLLKQNDRAAAEATFREVAALLERLVREAPDQPETRRILSGIYSRWSRLALAHGDISSAAAKADQACELAEQLVAQHPNDPRYARRLMQVDMHRARVSLAHNDTADARVHCQRAADMCRSLAESAGIKAADAAYYGRCLIGLPVADLQDVDSAAAIAERALAASGDQSPEAWELLAQCHQKCGRLTLARQCYDQALAHLPIDDLARRERVQGVRASLPLESPTQ